MNIGIHAGNSSGHKGVFLDKKREKWLAHIGLNKKRITIGRFDTIEEAVSARKQASLTLHGNFSHL
jgi:hypothetical protein